MIKDFLLVPKKETATDIGALIMRVGFGTWMLIGHGIPKLQKFMAGPPFQFGDPLGLGVTASFYLIFFAEFFCSILLILGLLTRLAVIPLFIGMLVVVTLVKWGQGFGEMEMALLYLTSFLAIFMLGPGKYSLDQLIFGR